MDENLVGYLLDALEPDERRKVEMYLRANPEARQRLQRVRKGLEPLEADLQPIDPPRDLWVRTLARVAEHQCRPLPSAPLPPRSRAVPAQRGWWRRADVLVAASLLFGILLLLPYGVNHLRYIHNITACQNNLRAFYAALTDYSDRHQGKFPDVATPPAPYNVAGMFVPMLHQSGARLDQVFVSCPSNGRYRPSSLALEDALAMSGEEFLRLAPTLAGCYAYSLGYHDATGYHGLRLDPREPHNVSLAILADRPPRDVGQGNPANSPNHSGKGQNVLFVDGHCAWCITRMVGVDRDDIYLNHDNMVAAGLNCEDVVLGTSDAHP
jgi:prepilin-type processing-associated H-X9-DG protein